MTRASLGTMIRVLLIVLILVVGILLLWKFYSGDFTAEQSAIRTQEYPLAGFWKAPNCSVNYGLAIASVGNKLYSVTFCGPGGCYKPGTYRPNTPIIGDDAYRVIDANKIEVGTPSGNFAYVRCLSREAAQPAVSAGEPPAAPRR